MAVSPDDRFVYLQISFLHGFVQYDLLQDRVTRIVRRDDFATKTIQVGEKPYWATVSATGNHCYVAVSGQDRVSVISFDSEAEVASILVGRHPQRVRSGKLYLGEDLQPAKGR
jgi:YVTN family beta-propeller protein